MAKRVYSKSGTLESDNINCCPANSGCTTPEVYDPEVIKSECIFVEKVFDAVMFQDEVDRVIPQLIIPDFPVSGSEVEEFIEVSVTTNTSGTIIRDIVMSINGQTTPCDPTFVPGPGGIQQINLACIDTKECDSEGEGTPIIVDQQIEVLGEVEVKITGTFLTTGGEERKFSVSTIIDLDTLDSITLRKFARLCIPSTASTAKPSMAVLCGVLCDMVLSFGLDSLQVVGNDLIITGPILPFCIVCEMKIKIPAQICVLTTGYCNCADPVGLCTEYPPIFPQQQPNVKIIN